MSKSTTRRVALLSSSAFVAAGIAAAASLGLALTPTAALAQTCTPPTTAGPGDDNIVCTGGSGSAGTYPTGITFSSQGDLSVTTAPVAPSTNASISVTANGVNLTGNGDDNVSWDSNAGTVTGGTGTAGPVIHATSEDGDISVSTGTISGTAASVTHAVLAVSQTGDIAITGSSGMTASHAGNTGGAAIEARNASGALLINLGQDLERSNTINGGPGSALRTISGGDAQITTGSRTTLTAGTGGSNAVNATPTNAVVDLTMNGGATTTLDNSGSILSVASNRFDFDDRALRATGDGTLILNNHGRIHGVVNFTGLAGGVTFTTYSSEVISSTNSNGWHTRGDSVLSAAADIIRIAPTGVIYTGGQPGSGQAIDQIGNSNIALTTPIGGLATTIDFAGGDDLLDNQGMLALGEGRNCNISCDLRETVTYIDNLETFQNSGVIVLGSMTTVSADAPVISDRQANDRLVMTDGTHFIGAEGSRIVFDVNFGSAAGQAGCVGSTEITAFFTTAADCVDLRNGSTDGATLVTLRAANPNGAVSTFGTGEELFTAPIGRGGHQPEGIVLIDVGGGTSSAEHFTLDPASEGYTAVNGGMIDEGLFVYALVYDEGAQQHKLISRPGSAAQFGLMGQVAQSLWRSSAGSWFERQSELRDQVETDGLSNGLWLRASFSSAERDVVASEQLFGRTLTFDNSYEADSYSIVGGFDVVSSQAADSSYVAGINIGYSHADVEFQATPNTVDFDALTGGLYAGMSSGAFFVDGAVNATAFRSQHIIPALTLQATGYGLTLPTFVEFVEGEAPEARYDGRSVGARIEAGWRLPLAQGLFVEPTASFDYVRTTFEDAVIPSAYDPLASENVTIEFDDATSLRGAIGARLGLDSAVGDVNVRYSLLGRIGNEFEGETGSLIRNPGTDLALMDDAGGQFMEIGGAINVFNDGGTISLFVSGGAEFADDFQSLRGSLGGRFRF